MNAEWEQTINNESLLFKMQILSQVREPDEDMPKVLALPSEIHLVPSQEHNGKAVRKIKGNEGSRKQKTKGNTYIILI